jgi:hypothetical protein
LETDQLAAGSDGDQGRGAGATIGCPSNTNSLFFIPKPACRCDKRMGPTPLRSLILRKYIDDGDNDNTPEGAGQRLAERSDHGIPILAFCEELSLEKFDAEIYCTT